MKRISFVCLRIAAAGALALAMQSGGYAQFRDVNGVYVAGNGARLAVEGVPINNGEKIVVSVGDSEVDAFRAEGSGGPYIFRDRDCIIQFIPQVSPGSRQFRVQNNGLCAGKNADFGTLAGEFVRLDPSNPRAAAMPSPQGKGPSFDCRRSFHPTEQAICNVAELAALDRDMAALFAAAMAASPSAQYLRSAQRNWIGTRNHCGINVDCLRGVFQQRIAELKAAANATAPNPPRPFSGNPAPQSPPQPPAVAQPGPIAPPPGPAPSVSSAIIGEWQGFYSCANGSSDLTLAIRDAGQNQLVARATFRPQRRSNAGEFELAGTFDPATRRFELRYTKWINKLFNYEMVGYRGQVDPDGRQLRGEVVFPGCSPITLARSTGAPAAAQQAGAAPPAAPFAPPAADASPGRPQIQAAPPPAALPDADRAEVGAISGVWEGRALCNKTTSDLLLKVRLGFSGDIEAVSERYGADALQRPVPRFDFVGRREGNDLTFRFVPARGTTGTGFNATLSGDELSTSSGACEPSTFRRVTPLSPSRVLTVPVPPNGGTYRPGDSLENRCLALTQWAARISREYPDMDMKRTAMEKLHAKGALLFADDDFVPVFGFSYDNGIAAELAAPAARNRQPGFASGQNASSPQDALRSAWQDINFECQKDPFIRDRGGWVWGHPLLEPLRTDAHSYYGGQFSAAAIIYIARSVRAIRNALKSGPAAAGGGDFKARTAELIDIRTKLSGQSDSLWPSELKAAKDAIALSLNELGAAEGERVLAKIQSATNPGTGLQLIKDALRPETADFLKIAAPARAADFRERLEAKRTIFGAELARPFLDRAEKAPESMDGAKSVGGVINESNVALTLLSDPDRNQYRKQLEARRDKIIQGLVAGDLETLRNFAPGIAGLKDGAKWIAEFESRYREYSALAAVREGKTAFVKDRSYRLASAVQEAYSALSKIDASSSSNGAAKNLIADFLSWDGDRRLPESLEYDVLAAQFGAFDP